MAVKKRTTKKVSLPAIIAATVELTKKKQSIEPLNLDTGREDFNQIVAKINEIIQKHG